MSAIVQRKGKINTERPKRVRNGTKGKDTVIRVLDHAARLFSERGYADVGLEEIARVSGLSKGALFSHFTSKREIYIESVSRVFELTLGPYEQPHGRMSNIARLRHYLNWICPVMAENRLMCRLGLRLILERDVDLLQQLLQGPFRRNHEVFMELLKSIKPKSDPRVIAFFVYAILFLNDELVDFADIWAPNTANVVGGEKSAAHIEALIKGM